MVLSDWLLSQKHDNSNLHEIIVVSICMHNTLHEKYYNIGKSEKYLVQMWSQTGSSGIKLSIGHGVSKNLDPNIQPKKQNIRLLKGNEISQEKQAVGQERAGIRRRKPLPINQTITEPLELSKKIPEVSKIRKKSKNSSRFNNPSAISKQP